MNELIPYWGLIITFVFIGSVILIHKSKFDINMGDFFSPLVGCLFLLTFVGVLAFWIPSAECLMLPKLRGCYTVLHDTYPWKWFFS